MSALPVPDSRTAVEACADAMHGDLGWALGTVFRRYLKAANQALRDLPGGPRGYQVLRSAASETPSPQLVLAQQLGVDRTVMTYLLDDLEKAGLIERLADPSDRRVRRIAATAQGRARLAEYRERLALAEVHTLSGLPEADQATMRQLLNHLARQVSGSEPSTNPCQAVEEAGLNHGDLQVRRPRRAPRRG
jgi:DNA-binding MarR family transcriptional regulator